MSVVAASTTSRPVRLSYVGRRGGAIKRASGSVRSLVPGVDDVEPLAQSVSSEVGVAVGVLALGALLVKTALHFKKQFTLADVLGSRVAPESVVIDLGIDTKNLYYYPKSTKLVVCVAEDVNSVLVNQVAMETAIPVLPRSAPISGSLPRSAPISGSGEGDLFWGQRAQSADAVVTTGCLQKLTNEEVKIVAKKAAKVLQGGGRFIFVEPAAADRGQLLFDAIESTGEFQSPIAFDEDWARLPLFPHAVGVAVKKEKQDDSAADEGVRTMKSVRSRRRK